MNDKHFNHCAEIWGLQKGEKRRMETKQLIIDLVVKITGNSVVSQSVMVQFTEEKKIYNNYSRGNE